MNITKSSFLVGWLCLFCLFYIPLNFSSWMFNALPLVSVRLILTLVLVFVLFSRKILVTKSEFAFLLLSVAYCTAEWLYNPAYNKNFINDLILFMFCFSFYIIQKDMQNLKVKVIKVWVGIVSLASISSVLSCVLYAFLPSTFFPAGYDGYATVINPLGFIHLETGGFRPSWFFAEPSYLGFYLGANLLFVYRYYKTRLPKSAFKLFMMIYLLSCFTVQSGTIVVSLAFSFLISIFYKLAFKSTTTLYWLLVALMIVVLIVVLELDLMEIYTSYNLLSSLGDRQSRMISSAEIYQDMSAWEYLWGKGSDYVALLNGRGESNTYYKIFIEQGTVPLVLFLIYIKFFLRKSVFALAFVLIAFNSTICHFSPMTFFYFIALYNFYGSQHMEESRTYRIIGNRVVAL